MFRASLRVMALARSIRLDSSIIPLRHALDLELVS
jgi:hypothetical protein